MLTDEERKQLLCDVGCTGEHSRYCAAAMPGVYRVQMEADDLTERVESIVASRVRAARAQELRDAADLIAVTKFNDPFGVNREAWKLLRDRADRLDATDQLQDPKD